MNHRSIATLGIGFGAVGIATIGLLAAQPEAKNDLVVRPAYYSVANSAVFVPYPHRKPEIAPPKIEPPQPLDGFDEDDLMLALFAVSRLS